SIDKSKAISEVAVQMGKVARVHLKVDTGMERIGVHWYNADSFISETFLLPGVQVEGLFSHLAQADDPDSSRKQIMRFDSIVQKLKQEKRCPPLVHLLNSSGIVNYPDFQYDMIRAGIVLYGYTPEIQEKLKPVMSLMTKVSYFKVVLKDVGIGYNHTHKTIEQTRVVTLPVGYGDGYLRLFSNKGEVLIRGKAYPVVGNVCMDQTMVDIGPNGEAYCDDDVEMFGSHIKLEEICQKVGTIPYEILCCISNRVPRIYL
ncbi:MAG: alanine racemase, partial [Alphaproteobacteria bacterium]|nr:alanine racemase [Alphaproteobacteria bacterium]